MSTAEDNQPRYTTARLHAELKRQRHMPDAKRLKKPPPSSTRLGDAMAA